MGASRRSTIDGYVPDLCCRLRARLGELEAETRAIRDALDRLETPRRAGAATASRRAQREVNEDETVILRALQESPGSRASMLALATELEPADVRSVLERLESSGIVRRDGLGWRIPPWTGAYAERTDYGLNPDG